MTISRIKMELWIMHILFVNASNRDLAVYLLRTIKYSSISWQKVELTCVSTCCHSVNRIIALYSTKQNCDDMIIISVCIP